MSSYKKYLAGIMAATMVAGSSFAAFAADQQGTGQGTGTLDIVENSDVFDVIVPTSGGTTFNYILDPTGVISKTSAEKYNGATFIANKRVYFGQIADIDTASGGVGGTVQQYDDTSDKIVVTNKSSMDVNISVAATVQSPEGAGIKLVDNKTFDASDKNPSVYLALTEFTSLFN